MTTDVFYTGHAHISHLGQSRRGPSVTSCGQPHLTLSLAAAESELKETGQSIICVEKKTTSLWPGGAVLRVRRRKGGIYTHTRASTRLHVHIHTLSPKFFPDAGVVVVVVNLAVPNLTLSVSVDARCSLFYFGAGFKDDSTAICSCSNLF